MPWSGRARDGIPSGAIIDTVRTTEKGGLAMTRAGFGTQAPHHSGYHRAALGRGDSRASIQDRDGASLAKLLGRFPTR